MRRRWNLVVLLLLTAALASGQQQPTLDLAPDATGALSQGQMRELFRVVADKDIENDKRLRNYTYVERDEDHKLDGKGQVKSTEARTYEVMELYGEQVQRLIQKDDKPLSAKKGASSCARSPTLTIFVWSAPSLLTAATPGSLTPTRVPATSRI